MLHAECRFFLVQNGCAEGKQASLWQMWVMRASMTWPCNGLKRNLAQREARGSIMRET